MAQTFRDFVIECELYPYSKENFEIMKECSELRLQEKYLENARYIAASASMYTVENGYHLSEGYFQEAVDASFLEATEDAAEKKKVGIFGKILKGIQWLIGKLAKFFAFIAGKLDKLAGNTEKVAEKVQVFDISPENIENVKDALMLKGNSLLTSVKNISTTGIDITKLHITGVAAEVVNYIKYYLAILFGTDEIRILPNNTSGPLNLADYVTDTTGIVDIGTLNEVINVISSVKNEKYMVSTSALTGAIARFDKAVETTKKTGVDISLKPAKIQEIQAQLVKNQTAIEKLQKFVTDKSNEQADFGLVSQDLTMISTFISQKLTGAVSATIRFYSDLLKYKDQALKNLNELVDKAAPAEEEQKAEETPAESK